MSSKYEKGSEWRKWDLHVHTPDSIIENYSGPDKWDKFIQELENLPPEFKVIGINDYIFLDGYKRILEYKDNGRLANIDLFLPVIELRLDKFGGSLGHLNSVNYHIIFSNELTPEMIEQQFLNTLTSKYELLPTYGHFESSGAWKAVPTLQSLKELGQLIIESVPEQKRSEFGSALKEGFNNLCTSIEAIQEALDKPYFKGKAITAVGKTEWADIKWNDRSIAEKKTIINKADLVFISSETIEDWKKAKEKLKSEGVNHYLLDCSDAHSFSNSQYKDKIGKCFTWIKADPTFEGLRQVLSDPDERIFVGEFPPKLEKVQNNKTKYIRSISIKQKESASFGEVWFDNTIPLNPGLVAIIGNKGKGKSALTDIIGLLCNTKQHEDFTFLSRKNFRQPNDNKAKHFQATLVWESGVEVTKGLEEEVDEQQPELIKYIPQNYLDKICTQLGEIEETSFDQELKKVIFSHVEEKDRLGEATLDKLIGFKTSEANKKANILKQELHAINEEIITLEEKVRPEHKQTLKNLLTQKHLELEAHEKSKPEKVPQPENDPEKQKELSEITLEIEAVKKDLEECESQIVKASEQQAEKIKLIAIVDKLFEKLDNLKYQIQTFKEESTDDFEALGLSVDSILKIVINEVTLQERRQSIEEEKKEIDRQLNPSETDSLAEKKISIKEKISKLETKLDEPNKNYQIYLVALKEWGQQKDRIIGNETTPETVRYFEDQIQKLEDIPRQLEETKARRLARSKEIHTIIRQLADLYRNLYAPVQHFIESHPLAKEKFQLNFEVGIVDRGFENSFFDIVTHGATGTFCGKEQGRKKLKAILDGHDFSTEKGVETFLTDIINSLESDQRPDGKTVRIIDQIKKSKSVAMLYDMIFSLEYLKPRYSLKMGEKELHQLSPGERGTLLLVFYLLVDKDDIPIVIDQPEENLDNQTVYELLVPSVKEAKQKRQIVIVTHNPNLAVVCDAEQVICADLDKKSNNTMHYQSGALEDPATNEAVVDILEGTPPAFNTRDKKYIRGHQWN